MRIKVEKMLNTETMLKMKLQDKSRPLHSPALVPVRDIPTVCSRSTFYTDLSQVSIILSFYS